MTTTIDPTAVELFGTDGVRGRTGLFPIDEDGAYLLGQATAAVMANGTQRILIGRDPRPGGAELAAALVDGICAAGCEAHDLGVVPTPAVAALLHLEGGDAGLVISASHNPADENGFKVFGPGGAKLPLALEAEIEATFRHHLGAHGRVRVVGARGRRIERADGAERYVEFAVGTVEPRVNLKGRHVAVDCANGATGYTTPAALKRLGVVVSADGHDQQGESINRDCGSLHPEHVRAVTQLHGAEVGLAHDGDGDRVVFIDEHGDAVDGDRVLGLIALWLHQTGHLAGGHVVGTVMTNIGLEKWLREHGMTLHRSAVGDRNVWALMNEVGADLGGEPSGHTIFRHLLPTDDALLTALQVLSVWSVSGQSLADLAGAIPIMPQRSRNLKVLSKPPIETLPPVHSALAEAETWLNGEGRMVVRYSGTELKARVMAEGPDEDVLQRVVDRVSNSFQDAGIAA